MRLTHIPNKTNCSDMLPQVPLLPLLKDIKADHAHYKITSLNYSSKLCCCPQVNLIHASSIQSITLNILHRGLTRKEEKT